MSDETHDVEYERRALLEDLHRIGLAGSLVALELTPEAAARASSPAPLIVLPIDFVLAAGTPSLSTERLATGLAETVTLLRPYGDSLLLGTSLLTRAQLLRLRTSMERRWDVLAEAIAVFERLDVPGQVGRCLLELGNVMRDSDLMYDALTAYARAHQLLSQVGDLAWLRLVHYHRAIVYRTTSLFEEAILELDQMAALGLSAATDARVMAGWSVERIACAIEIGDLAMARTLVDQLCDRYDDPNDFNTAVGLYLRARVYSALGEDAAALEDLAAALAVGAQSTSQYSTVAFRTTEREQLDALVTTAMTVALRNHATHLLVGTLVLAKSLSPGAFQAPAAAASRASEPLDQHRLQETTALAMQATTATLFWRESDLDEISRHASLLVDAHRVLAGQAASGEVPSLTETVALLQQRLTGRTLAAELFSTPDGVLWIATVRDTGLDLLPTSMNLVEAVVLAAAAGREIWARQPCRALDRLATGLLEPLRDQLNEIDRLNLVLPPELTNVPLHAAEVRGLPLLSQVRVGYLPSFGFLLGTGRAEPARSEPSIALVVADPIYGDYEPLPAAAAEAQSLAELLPGVRVHTDTATSELLATDARHAPVLHITGHAVFDERRPLLAQILLADRPAFAFEIADLQFASEVVNLSGCRTAGARWYRGGESEGLGAAFLTAGAQTVVATWWPVSDRAAAAFNRSFYGELGTGAHAWDAVHVAQQKVRQEFSDHVDWAPFVALGAPLEGHP